MSRTVRAYLQLVRAPNLFSAAGDSLAGWYLAGGMGASAGIAAKSSGPLGLMAASMAIYAAGIALNDLSDIEIDRVERPGRPLPSGAASKRIALAIVVVGFAAGIGAAWFSTGVPGLVVASVLVAAVLAYDVWLRRTTIGPIAMGSCRGVNLLLGASVAPALGGWPLWGTATAYGTFVAGLTLISRDEAVESGRKPLLLFGRAAQELGVLTLAALIFAHASYPGGREVPVWMTTIGLLILASAAFFVHRAASSAIRSPAPERLRGSVKTSLLALPWLHVGLISGVVGVVPASSVAVLWVPAYLLGRWLEAT